MVWHFALYTQTECTVDCGSARAILPLMSPSLLSLLWGCFCLFLSLSSFHVSARFLHFWQRERRAVGSRLVGRARMPVRGLASGRSWCLMRYDFAPFFAPISAFSRFLCIGFFGSCFFFFHFFPFFSLDSSSFWCGCSVIDCIFDFSGLGIQQLIGFFGLLIVCVFGFLGFVLGMLAFRRLCVLGVGYWFN